MTPSPKPNWPPAVLERMYCRYAHRFNRFALMVVLAGFSVLLAGLAWTLVTAP